MRKSVGYFLIALGLKDLTLDEEVTLAMGIKLAGDPDATAPPYTQPQLQALATTVQTDLGGNITGRSLTLTAKQQQDVNALTRAIVAVKGYVEVVANAKANGDRPVFDQVVTRIGFASKKPAAAHAPVFESLTSDSGSIHVRVPSEGTHGMTYVYRYGITTARGVLPTLWQPEVPLSVVDLIVTGLPSGSIVAVQYAVVDHPRQSAKAKASAKTPQTTLTVPAINKAGKVTFVHGTTFLIFSDAIYIVVP